MPKLTYLFICLFLIIFKVNASNTHLTDTLQIVQLLKSGDSLTQKSPNKAKNQYLKAAYFLDSSPEATHLLKAKVYSKLGKFFYQTGNYAQAIEYLLNALSFFDTINNHRQVANQLSQLGLAFYFSDVVEMDKALNYYKRAEKLFLKLGMYEEALLNYNYSGYIYWANNYKQQALDIHLKAFSKFDSLNNLRGKTISCSDAGFTLNSLKQFNKALQYNLIALEFAKQLNDSAVLTPILNNIAISYQQLGELDKSIEFSTKSLTIAKRKKYNLRKKEALETLHQSYSLQNNFAMAYQYYIQYSLVKDSLTNAKKVKQILKLENALEAQKAEAENKIAKEKELLQKQKQQYLQYFLWLMLLLALVVIFVTYRNYRIKKENEIKLSAKNKQLQQLLTDLKEAQTKLVQSEKIAALGVLLSGVSHEIKNPLNYIQGSVFGLRSETTKSNFNHKEINTLIDYIEVGVKRINNIIKHLDKYWQANAQQKPMPIDIHELLSEVILSFKSQLEVKNAKVVNEFYNSPLRVKATWAGLDKVFSSVFSNAVFAIANGGEISIKTEHQNNFAVITISDNGIGMHAEALNKVFDPFYTTRKPGEGPGLGMYISYQLIHALNGKINLSSTPKKGTVVKIEIPTNT